MSSIQTFIGQKTNKGQSISLAHLAPFVDISRKAIRKTVIEELDGLNPTEEQIEAIVEKRLKKEIKDGVQMIQYQVITLMTCNGQAPFITVFMYLNEVDDPQTKHDLALIIEEMLNQRIIGVKNKKGVYITPAFPKLIYVLEPDNIEENSPYYYLTELAAKCTARRMVPDYISEKKMKELKEGYCFPVMGCVEGSDVVTYKFNGQLYVEGFERMWNRMSLYFIAKEQSKNSPHLYMDLDGVEIYDKKEGFVKTKRIIRNYSSNWVKVTMSNGRTLVCTEDHPFPTNRGRIFAKDLIVGGDEIEFNRTQYSEETSHIDPELAWALGAFLSNGIFIDLYTPYLKCKDEDLSLNTDFLYITNKYFKHIYNDYDIVKMHDEFVKIFGGTEDNKHIPNVIFSVVRKSKLAFLAGMIDVADVEYIDETKTTVRMKIANKELALQVMLLAQSLGMPANIYDDTPTIPLISVEFKMTNELINEMRSNSKPDNYLENENDMINHPDFGIVESIEYISNNDYSYDVTTESDHFDVSGIYSHNCRSALSVWHDPETGKAKFYGRFNQGVVTINLVDVACSSNGNEEEFWKILEDRLQNLCFPALMARHKRLLGTPSDVAPILWQDGAIARLEKGETIDKLLFGGYSTISLGFAGLSECVYRMKGVSHFDPSATEFALKVMQRLTDACKEWFDETNIGFSVYGTPLESTTYKFAKCLQKRFGVIENVTDHNYITNSYHINVREHVNAFDKLKFESQFQALSSGGAISYIETPDLNNNIESVLTVMKFIYDNIMYAELNTKSDYCHVCGSTSEIRIITDEFGKLIWECPKCGNRDQNKMNVARRTCGYIGNQFWNQGRTSEINDRVMHLDNEDYDEE